MNQRSLTAQILGSVENARHYLGQSMQVNEANGITVDRGRKSGAETLFLVRRNGTPIGFVTKITNTRTTTHPYKATAYDGGYNPDTATDATDYKSTFLGVTYTPGKAGMQKAVNAVATRTPLKGDPATNEARKTKTYKRDDCSVTTWFERDRAHVAIECGNDTVAEWWDDDVQDMADSGYFTMNKGDAALERSVLDYAVEMGLISEGVNEASIRDVRAMIAKNNAEYGTSFSIGGAYGNHELWAKDSSGGDHRLEAGSATEVYNAFVRERFKEKWRGNKTAPVGEAARPFPYYKLDADEVLDAYVEAALWSSTDDDGEPLDAKYDRSDIAPSTLAAMKRDVEKFVSVLKRAKDLDLDGWSNDQIGHDLWLSRNGHGAGFFDRDLPSKDRLQKFAQAMREVDLYVGDDGKVYSMRESVSESVKTQAGAQKAVQSHGIDIGTYRRLLKSLGDATPGSMLVLSVTEPDAEYAKRTGLGASAEIKIVQAGDSTELRGHDIKRTVGSTSSRTWSGNSQTVTVLAVNESVNEARGWDYTRKGPGLLITAPDGRTCWLQGDEASELEDQLDAAKNQSQIDRILDAYDSVCEARTPRSGSVQLAQYIADWMDSDRPTVTDLGNTYHFDVKTAKDIYAWHAATIKSGSGRAEFVQKVAAILQKVSDKNNIKAAYSESTGAADVDAILEAKRKAKGIYRTGENGVFFIANKDIDKGKVAKTDAKMAKKYGKDFAGLSPAEKLKRIRGGMSKAAKSGDTAKHREHLKDYDAVASKGAGKKAAIAARDKADKARYGKRASWNESVAETETDDNYMPDGGTEESRSYYFLMHRAKKDGMNTEKPTVFNFVLDVSKRLDYDIDAGLALARHVLQLAMGDTPLPAPVLAVVGRGPIPPAVRKITVLPRWAVAVGTLTLSKAAAFAVLILEDMNAHAECRALADALATLVRRSGSESVVEGRITQELPLLNKPSSRFLSFADWRSSREHKIKRSGSDMTYVGYQMGRGANPTGTVFWPGATSKEAVLRAQYALERFEAGEYTGAERENVARFYLEPARLARKTREHAKIGLDIDGYPLDPAADARRRAVMGEQSQETTEMNIAQRALIEARKKMGGGSDVSKEVSEISTGARTMGFLLSDAPQSEKDKIAPSGKSFVSPSNTVAKIESFLGSVEEAQQKLTKAELILMDRKRKKREKRGKGLNATGKQRLAAKRNVKKAQRAMLKGSTQRKLARTKARRAKLRGKN